MDFITHIETIVREPLLALGYGIVRVRLRGSTQKTLELMIEREDGKPVRMEDCVRASREASAHLDVADPIESSYVLEVSSPGLDRPLVRRQDYERFAHQTIKVQTHIPIGQSRRFQGLLLGIQDEKILLRIADPGQGEATILEIPLQEIRDARLVPPLESGDTQKRKKQ